MEGITNKQVYRCYDENLKKFLYKNGIKYFLTAFDAKTMIQFWAYYKSSKFERLLEEWIKNNPKMGENNYGRISK